MNELPDIPGIMDNAESIAAKQAPRNNKTFSALLILFFAVLISSVVSVTCVMLGKERILSVLGYVEPPKPDILLPINKKMAELETKHIETIQDIGSQLAELKSELAAVSLKKDQLNTRLSLLENSTADFRKEIQAKIIAEQKKQHAVVKQHIQTKPKQVIVPVAIVSIRGWGNEAYVTLKEGFDYSELLAVGDSWRGWTLLSADANSRKATFRVHDQVKELVM
jgi:hypothetical protein